MFYIPHWLWKSCEGGKIEAIVAGLGVPIMSTSERKTRVTALKDYIFTSLHTHNFYAFKFFVCEILNFVNVLSHMWFLDRFLGGTFMTYGLDVINFSEKHQLERTDPMIEVFPRITKCTFMHFGPSGSHVNHELMCILALNVLNEKIFVFLWFWFVILTTLTCISFLYRVLVICVPVIRKGLLQRRGHIRYKVIIETITPKLQFGDYFLLYLISKNIEMMSFSSLLEELALEVNHRLMEPTDQEMQPLKTPPVVVDENRNEKLKALRAKV